MARDTLELTAVAPTLVLALQIRPSELLARLAAHSHAVRLEKARIELRAELGRRPSELEAWLEFQGRHPYAAQHLLESAVGARGLDASLVRPARPEPSGTSASRRLLARLATAMVLLLAGGRATSAAPPGLLPALFSGESVEVCFVPGSDCGALIAHEIDTARSAIRIQAYTFTSPRISHALERARRRGVDVVALLDEREAGQANETAAIRALVEAKVAVRLDGAHSTAHNKVLVIDSATVITGSLNFSVSAERYSAENVLFIRGNPRLVRAYLDNFALHWAHSQALR